MLVVLLASRQTRRASGLFQNRSKWLISVVAVQYPQCRDVVHHQIHPGSNRVKAGRPQKVQRHGAQRGHSSGAIAADTVGNLVELGDADSLRWQPSMLQRSQTS